VADGLKSNPDRHVKCPKCNYRYHYRLGDGRRMCKRCRKRFTYKPSRRGLSEEKRELIAELFWLEVTAARAAKKVGVHPNTVAKYYRIIRERIAADREAELEKLEGHIEVDESYFGGHRKGKRGRGAGGKIPVFGLLKRGGEVRVILPPNCSEKHLLGAILENVELDSIVYSDGWKAYNKLSLNGFHHKRINHQEEFANGKNHINGIENFWGYAKRRLKAYHGGFKHKFSLFIREMEFRFNQRNDPGMIDYLKSILIGP